MKRKAARKFAKALDKLWLRLDNAHDIISEIQDEIDHMYDIDSDVTDASEEIYLESIRKADGIAEFK